LNNGRQENRVPFVLSDHGEGESGAVDGEDLFDVDGIGTWNGGSKDTQAAVIRIIQLAQNFYAHSQYLAPFHDYIMTCVSRLD
jgi:hypothetical protein